MSDELVFKPWTGCGVCGGKLAMIRGRHPGDREREVCPTCVVERLETLVSSLQSAQCSMNPTAQDSRTAK
jgi:hypothetical protein